MRLEMDEDLTVSLNDRCVTLLENVVADNRRLREMIEARDAEQQRLLQLVATKLNSPSKNNTASRKRKRRIPVSQHCRVSILVSFSSFSLFCVLFLWKTSDKLQVFIEWRWR